MGEVEVKGRQTGAEGGCRGRQASGEPAAVLPPTPMTLVGHDAEPAPALKQPRHGVGTSGDPAPRGRESESKSQACGISSRAPLRGRVGGEALSVALKTRRAGGKAWRSARRCAVPGPQGRQGRSRQGRPGPSPPRPRARSPCPAQSRSARTAAERMANPGRRAAGGLGAGAARTGARGGWTGRSGRPRRHRRGDGGRKVSVCVRLSIRPPPFPSGLGHCSSGTLAPHLYTPRTPEMTS